MSRAECLTFSQPSSSPFSLLKRWYLSQFRDSSQKLILSSPSLPPFNSSYSNSKMSLETPASLPVIAMIVARSPQWFINYSLWFPVCPPPIYFPQNSTENQAISFSWETLQWFPIAVFWLSRPWSSGSCLPLLPHILPLAPLRFCSTRTDFLSVPQRAQSFSHVSILVQLPSLPGMRFHPFLSGQPSPSTGRNYN